MKGKIRKKTNPKHLIISSPCPDVFQSSVLFRGYHFVADISNTICEMAVAASDDFICIKKSYDPLPE